MQRRALFAALLATPALATPALAPAALAQVLDRPARIIIGFPPGGSLDLVARLYAEQLRGRYAPQMLVESRSGAGGRLAVEAVKAAAPDGATMLITPASVMTLHPHIFPQQMRYDAAADFIAVTALCDIAFALVVAPGHPARDAAGFVQWAQAQPGPISYGLPSAGSSAHFAGMRMAETLGVRMTDVPYRGTAPILTDLMGGQIPAAVLPLGGVPPLHREGRVRILGVTASRAMGSMPDVRSFAEQGWRDLVVEEWFGLFLPARSPAPLVAALHAAALAAAATPAVRNGLARVDYAAATTPPGVLAQRLAAEHAQWGEQVRRTGFKLEE